MNYENLKTLAETACEYTVGGVPSLYCDGSLICIAGGLTVKDGRFLERAIKYWGKALMETLPPLLSVGAMRGQDFPHDPYIRELTGESFSVVIQEKYVRCFDADAQFYGEGPQKRVIVCEYGVMVGVVMPMKPCTLEWPIVQFAEDSVVYHKCPSQYE